MSSAYAQSTVFAVSPMAAIGRAAAQDFSVNEGLSPAASREVVKTIAELGPNAGIALQACYPFIQLASTFGGLEWAQGQGGAGLVAAAGSLSNQAISSIGLDAATGLADIVIAVKAESAMTSRALANQIRWLCVRAFRHDAAFLGVDLRGVADAADAAQIARRAAAARRDAKALGYAEIHIAALSSDSSLLGRALENGEDVDARTVAGETALHLAAFRGTSEIVEPLLKAGADANALTPRH